MFVAMFDLHAQYPILSPFALSLGAAPSFIGLMMGVYSITHLPGNLIAGWMTDRFGSKPLIVASLIAAGCALLYQSTVTDPWQLLVIRSISGFVLAFLSPACQSMLAKLADDTVLQGKLMAGNGLVHTLASVVSPAAGALLVAKIGFDATFTLLGWGLIVTGALAGFGIPIAKAAKAASSGAGGVGTSAPGKPRPKAGSGAAPVGAADDLAAGDKGYGGLPWLFFLTPMAISCSQGILFFELPLMKVSQDSILASGILFSMVSLGALFTLSLLFLQRYSPHRRTVVGALGLALVFFGLAVDWPVPLMLSLALVGVAKGLIFPAMSTLLITLTSENRYGRVFSLLSIALSVGAFLGPTLAGRFRDDVSPFILAFAALMIALAVLPPPRKRRAPGPAGSSPRHILH